MNNVKLASLLLRIGLAFVFTYAALEIFVSPGQFLKYIPSALLQLIPLDIFLIAFASSEILLSLWLLWGRWAYVSGAISAMIMILIVACNPNEFSVLFRNVAIMFAGWSLVALSWPVKATSPAPMIVAPPIQTTVPNQGVHSDLPK